MNKSNKSDALTLTEEDRKNARDDVYHAIAEALPKTADEARDLALAHALIPPKPVTHAEWKRSEGAIAAIERMDLEPIVQNLGGLTRAWFAMDTNDGGVGNLLEDFVDVMNAPENADNKSQRNLAKILDVADKLRTHLASKALAAE